ncbi:MAG TPA: hypothetical protein VER33_06885 [Polyangiaceae bacterium]|nr:hypothetical protein [Polyangiaceae bacterium]
MTRELTLRRGGSVKLVACSADRVTLETSFASPPGSTVELLLLDAPLSVKVKRCQRTMLPDRTVFLIEGRWVTLSREQREALLAE